MASPLSIARHVRRALARRRSDAPLDGELNIVPFLDIITNLLLFLLATAGSVMMVAQVDAQLPRGPRGASTNVVATPSVTIVARGVVIAGPGGFATAECTATTRTYAVAVPRRDGAIDSAALSACAARLHASLGQDDRVILSADPNVPYDELVRAMDALRADGDRPLFSDILLSAGVR
ncbi:ExbD/TolR family protein [Sandaracinus amylolyticus]|uniref:TolR-like protein n=1 Tax=Sandaracinus amylolyticus TaxID=927083 RepID=A0A0F6SDT2_9BACT|nr:biopolymer transporter ExbD [Sandaracinus amylolyticus]AKF03989.1 TolR-like protein [Sandaracinus amylolyticus]